MKLDVQYVPVVYWGVSEEFCSRCAEIRVHDAPEILNTISHHALQRMMQSSAT
jgi:hypothetical protein